jgi:hypothetical protein
MDRHSVFNWADLSVYKWADPSVKEWADHVVCEWAGLPVGIFSINENDNLDHANATVFKSVHVFANYRYLLLLYCATPVASGTVC